jgi:tRNA (mo5U34)-methyltransferase
MSGAMEGPTQTEVDSIPWWHSFTFPNGVKAKGRKGGDNSEEVLRGEARAALNYPVQGKTVLDVGAWNGYFSVEAVRHGSKRVVALDKFV